MDIPDWRSIGRRLKKRFDEIINPSPRNPSPSPSERRRQREQDAILKGFVYFDTFDEVYAWHRADVDPIQLSNTRLIERPRTGEGDQNSKILLCHDYKGGYNDYESVNPSECDHEEYSCGYLQYVDTFIYFSHKLVCCPPPSWINTCHRNGVRILGTFIVEPQTPEIQRMLEQEDGSFRLALQLTAMAEEYGFDGWLLNVEKCFPKEFFTQDAISKLLRFVRCLREKMGEGKSVVWYDALTSDNEVKYQNGLTDKNLEFAKAAGLLFTNYKWTEDNARKAVETVKRNGMNVGDVYFGVDVWAQNVGMKPPRVTYPVRGGGGTGTGLAVNTLANLGLSTAIFAPGWTFEHFDSSNSADVDLCMWSGGALPSPLPCSCNPQTPHELPHSSQADHPITRFVQERPAGSERYFFTDFQKAFNTSGQGAIRSLLGNQSVLPKCLPLPRWEYEKSMTKPNHRFLYGRHDSDFIIWTACTAPNSEAKIYPQIDLDLELFSVSMPVVPATPLQLQIEYIRHYEKPNVTANIEIFLRYSGVEGNRPQYQTQILRSDRTLPSDHVYKSHFSISPPTPNPIARLTTIGIRCSLEGSVGVDIIPDPQRLMTLKKLSILPEGYAPPSANITDIQITTRGEPQSTHERLSWRWNVSSDLLSSCPDGVPRSPITGPFSHFQISLNGRVLGNAFASSFVLGDADLGELASIEPDEDRTAASLEVVVLVEGFFFGGGSVRTQTKVQRPAPIVQGAEHEDWVRL